MNKLIDLLSIPNFDHSDLYFNKLLKDLSLPTNLTDIGADTIEKRKILSKAVNSERMSNNPILFTEADVDKIFNLSEPA